MKIFNFQKNVQGITEEIHFDTNGMRDVFYVEVLERSKSDETNDYYQKFAIYDTENGLQFLRDFSNFDDQAQQSIQTKIFKVMMHEGMPMVRKKYVTIRMGIDLAYVSYTVLIQLFLLQKISKCCREYNRK